MAATRKLSACGIVGLMLAAACSGPESTGPTPPPPPPPPPENGYIGAREFGNDARIVWDAYVTEISAVPHVVGATLDGKLSMVNLVNGSVTGVSGIMNVDRLRGPGMTSTPGVWVMRDGDLLKTYQLSLAPVMIAEHPELGTAFTRQAARLSDDVWMTTTSQFLSVRKRAGPGEPYTEVTMLQGMSEPEGVHLSPAGDRATIRVDRVILGVPVIDAMSGELAYRMSLVSVQGVDFSADGASMLVVGHKEKMPVPESGDVSVIEVLRTSDGAVEASRTLPYVAFAAILDPASDRVLVAGTKGSRGNFRPVLMVLNRSDLSTEAVFEVPMSAPSCGTVGDCLGGVVARTGDEVSIFHSWNGPPVQWRFTVPVD